MWGELPPGGNYQGKIFVEVKISGLKWKKTLGGGCYAGGNFFAIGVLVGVGGTENKN